MQAYMGGIAPTSLTNWKKNSCLEICLAGCDFKCPYCNAPEFLDFREEYLIDILEIKRQINSYEGQVETVLFTGGEPGLQRQALLNLARHCKQIGLDVGILTNGARPSSILSLLREDLIDFIELDIKSPLKTEIFEKVTRSSTFFRQTEEIIQNVKDTLEMLKKYNDKVKIFFRTTYVKTLMDKEEYFFEIAEQIKDMDATWKIQMFNKENVRADFEEYDTAELFVLKDNLKKKYPYLDIEII